MLDKDRANEVHAGTKEQTANWLADRASKNRRVGGADKVEILRWFQDASAKLPGLTSHLLQPRLRQPLKRIYPPRDSQPQSVNQGYRNQVLHQGRNSGKEDPSKDGRHGHECQAFHHVIQIVQNQPPWTRKTHLPRPWITQLLQLRNQPSPANRNHHLKWLRTYHRIQHLRRTVPYPWKNWTLTQKTKRPPRWRSFHFWHGQNFPPN